MGFPMIFPFFPWFSHDFPNFPTGFPMVFLWFSHFSHGFSHDFPNFPTGFPMVFLWFSHFPHGFSHDFPNFPTGFPMVFPWFSQLSYRFSYGFPMIFPFFPWVFPWFSQCSYRFSHGFPMILPIFPWVFPWVHLKQTFNRSGGQLGVEAPGGEHGRAAVNVARSDFCPMSADSCDIYAWWFGFIYLSIYIYIYIYRQYIYIYRQYIYIYIYRYVCIYIYIHIHVYVINIWFIGFWWEIVNGSDANMIPGWWFGTWLLSFPYIGNNHLNWRTHTFQRGWHNHQPVVFWWDFLQGIHSYHHRPWEWQLI